VGGDGCEGKAVPDLVLLLYPQVGVCEAMLAASFACLSCERRRQSVGVLQVAVDVGAVVEESVARPPFTSLSQQGCICEAMLAASFAWLSCQRRRRSVGVCYK
jgi:hypothetical protein